MSDDELLSDPAIEQIAAAQLGDAAREFRDGDLCRYMLGIADQEIRLAQEAMEDVDPENKGALVKLQFKAKVARQFRQWLDETIHKGDEAIQEFKNGQQKN